MKKSYLFPANSRFFILLFLAMFFLLNGFGEKVVVLFDNSNPSHLKTVELFKSEAEFKGIGIEAVSVSDNEKENPLINSENRFQFGFALGAKAAEFLSQTTISGVFALVQNPYSLNLISQTDGAPIGKLTGVSFSPHLDDVFDAIKTIYPKKAKIGLVYSDVYPLSNVSLLHKTAELKDCTVEDRYLKNLHELLPVFHSLADRNANFIFADYDSLIYNNRNFSHLVQICIRGKCGLVGVSENMVKEGALMGVYPDLEETSKIAFSIIEKLIAGTPVSTISFAYNRKVLYAVNSLTAKILHLKISKSFLDKAIVFNSIGGDEKESGETTKPKRILRRNQF